VAGGPAREVVEVVQAEAGVDGEPQRRRLEGQARSAACQWAPGGKGL